MSIIVDVMVFDDAMKHDAQELSEKGRSILTSVILCSSKCFFNSLKSDVSCTVLTRERRQWSTKNRIGKIDSFC
jgi:hypothetical protein